MVVAARRRGQAGRPGLPNPVPGAGSGWNHRSTSQVFASFSFVFGPCPPAAAERKDTKLTERGAEKKKGRGGWGLPTITKQKPACSGSIVSHLFRAPSTSPPRIATPLHHHHQLTRTHNARNCRKGRTVIGAAAAAANKVPNALPGAGPVSETTVEPAAT